MMDASVAPKDFQQLYAAHADPWGYETNPYETGKYAVTLRLLPRRRFRCGFEIGCSIGVLTRLLAERCDWLLAVDVSELSLARARERCRGAARCQIRANADSQDVAGEKIRSDRAVRGAVLSIPP